MSKYIDKIMTEGKTELYCPFCKNYNVNFLNKKDRNYHRTEGIYNKLFYCTNCDDIIHYEKYDISLKDEEKYLIYRYWGFDALLIILEASIKKKVRPDTVKSFLASYFDKMCNNKGKDCTYYDILKGG